MRRHIRSFKDYVKGGGVGPFVIRATAGSAAVRVSSMMVAFGISVLLARGLGLHHYGNYALALSVITIAGIPGELGLTKLVTREVAVASAKNDDAALFGLLRWADRTCWLLSSLIALGIAVSAGVLIRYGSSALGWMLLVGTPVIPLIALARIRGGAMQGLSYITLGQIPANLIRPLLLASSLGTLYIWTGHLSPISAIALNSITAAAVFAIAHAWLHDRLPARTTPQMVKTGRQWLASSLPLALNDGMRTLQGELTVLLMGLMLLPTDVGLVRIALSSAVVAAAPMTILARVNMPMIARLYADGDTMRLQKLITYSAHVQTAGVAFLSLPLIITPELFLTTVYGDSYAPAANVMRIIVVAQIANAAFGPNGMLLNMTHHERRVTRAMAIAFVLNISTIVLLLGFGFGILGAAIGYVISLLSWNILTWLDGRRILSIDTSILALSPLKVRSRR